MKDDPHAIAAWLIQQHGLKDARSKALAKIMQAHEQEDNYALSVWRDVKRILEHAKDPEHVSPMPGAEVFAGMPSRAAGPRPAQSPAASDRALSEQIGLRPARSELTLAG